MGQDAFFRRTRCPARRPAAIGAAAVSCFAVLFLTMLCTLFYNIWLDDLRRLTAAEGDWQLRITGQFSEAQLTELRGFAHVARASLCPAAGGSDADAAPTTALELVFSPASAAPDEGPLIAAALGLDHDAALAQNTLQYHVELLALLLVRAPGDTAPRLLLPFYLAVLGIACLSLVLILQSSFAVEMRDKLRELGVLASIGATPGQLLRRLVGQALALTALPCLAGLAAGVGLSALSIGALLRFRAQLGIVQGQAEAGFACHPAILTAALLAGLGTILLSALLPAARLCRLTPLEALRGLPERPAPVRRGLLARLPRLAGPRSPEGLLAAAALRSQRQALRTGTLSLTLAFLAFVLIEGFFTLSQISTRYTYFERYQSAWDVMATLPGGAEAPESPADAFALKPRLAALPGVREAAVYQRAGGRVLLTAADQSGPLQALGGYEALTGAAAEGEVFGVPAELVILDDAAFMDYCAAQGLPRRLDGAVACDRVWDSLHSSFRHPAYLPFLQPGLARLTLAGAEGAENMAQAAALPLLGYADTPPLLREEYDRHSMALFLPETLWHQLQGGGEGAGLGVQPEDGPRIRLLAAEGAGAAELARLRQALAALLAEAGIPAETEDRIAERETNDEMIDGFRLVLGLGCGYLALIGLVGIFAHTLGFVRLRRREIARYASLGMTPAQLRRMFAREALTLAGRPVLAALVLGAAALTGMIRASELDPAEFWAEAPVLPLGCFVLAVFALVGLAYWLGARALLRADLAETLRDETRE